LWFGPSSKGYLKGLAISNSDNFKIMGNKKKNNKKTRRGGTSGTTTGTDSNVQNRAARIPAVPNQVAPAQHGDDSEGS
jgi:hypothetical protein